MECLFCGSPATEKVHAPKIGSQKVTSSWSWACLASICALFRIVHGDPLRQLLGESPICASCCQLMRDIDFSLRLLDKLFHQVEQLHEQLLQKVEMNWANRDKNNEAKDELLIHMVKKFRTETAAVNVGMERFRGLLLSKLHEKEPITGSCFGMYQPNSEMEDDLNITQEEDGEIKLEVDSDEDSSQDDWDMVEVDFIDEDTNDDENLKDEKEAGNKCRKYNIPCQFCHVKCASTEGLAIHQRKLHKDNSSDTLKIEEDDTDTDLDTRKNVPCPLCPVKCVSTWGLAIHNSRIHQKLKDPNWEEGESIKKNGDFDRNLWKEDEDEDHSDHSDYSDSQTTSCAKEDSSIIRDIPCPICPVKCATPRGLAIHTRRMHKKDNPQLSKDSESEDDTKEKDDKYEDDDEYLENQEDEDGDSDEDSDDYCPTKSIAGRKQKSSKHTIPCLLCPVKCATTAGLTMHHKKIHAKDGPPPNPSMRENNPCSLCGLGFPTKEEVQAHEIEHQRTISPFKGCLISRQTIFDSTPRREIISQTVLSKMGRQDREAFATRVIHYYKNITNFNKKMAYQHFLREGCPKSTICTILQRYDKTKNVNYKRIPGRPVSQATITKVIKKDGPPPNLPSRENNPCTLCGLGFPTKEGVQAHEIEHQNTTSPFTCTVCQIVTPNSARLRKHVLITHIKDSAHLCDICGRSFGGAFSLKNHRRMHPEVDYSENKCKVCDRRFTSNAALEIHSFKHAESKSAICDICGKGFTYPSSLRRHRVSHDEVFAHKCNICGKLFSHKQFLLKHELIHSGLKIYECRYCGKKFKTSANKWQHENNHCSNRKDNMGVQRKHNNSPDVVQE